MMVEEEKEKIYEAKAVATYNILKADIAYRICETINWAKIVYRRLVFGEDLSQAVPKFLESFRGLYEATCEFLKGKVKVGEKEVRKADYYGQLFFSLFNIQPQGETEEERTYNYYRELARRAIEFFAKYRAELKVCGLYDLRKFDIKPEFAWRKSI